MRFSESLGLNGWFVYLLRSLNKTDEVYIGITRDVESRLKDHNSGKSPHTAKFKPWECEAAVWFKDENKAHEFERYMKSHSGRAFRSKHF